MSELGELLLVLQPLGANLAAAKAAPRLRCGVVDQEISDHRAAEGSAEERCQHRVSQSRAPLSQAKVRKILDTTNRHNTTPYLVVWT